MKYDAFSSSLTKVAIEAAVKAGDVLKQGFGTSLKISSKTHAQDLVTEYDRKAESAIISHIRQQYPSHAFLAEESGAITPDNAEVRWVIDPLDGTMNFAHGIPIFAVSIGAFIEERLSIGIIFHPLMNELFVAERGKGAYLNGKRIHVSKVKDIVNAVAATGFPYSFSLSRIAQMVNFLDIGNPIRILGSAALNLAYIAAGRFDIYWGTNLSPWDVAAGKLIVEEAGGRITDLEGNELQLLDKLNVIASNHLLHEILLTNLL